MNRHSKTKKFLFQFSLKFNNKDKKYESKTVTSHGLNSNKVGDKNYFPNKMKPRNMSMTN